MSGDATITVVPADAASWEALRAVFGTRDEPSRCLCQRVLWPHRAWHDMPVPEREARLRAQVLEGYPMVAEAGGRCPGGS